MIAEVQDRIGSATIILAEGAPVRRGDQGALRHQWYVIQDSTMGVVFTEPSGIKTTQRLYDGDLDVQALRTIRAIKTRSATFTVWREFTGVIGVTSIRRRQPGENFNFDPVWRDIADPPHTHFISITWIHRVYYEDETSVIADIEPVLQLALRFSEGITGQDLEPNPDYITSISTS